MKKFYYLLCLMAFLFVGCELIEELETGTTDITIPAESSTVELDSNDVSQTITFIATADWVITLSETTKSTPSWISVSPMSGSAGSVTLSVTLDGNDSFEDRSVDIIISTESGAESISVTQAAFEPILSLSNSSESVTVDAGSFTFDVTSNLDWATTDVPEWITLTPSSGNGNQTITLSYTVNTEVETRSATIKFSDAIYEKEAEITVTQAALGANLSLSKSEESVAAEAGSFTFDVISNLDWATADVPDWITLSPSSGSGDQTITLSYTSNSTTETRSATIKFSNATYSKEVEFAITQVAFEPALTLNKSSESVAVDSGSITLDVTSNIEWTASDVPDWITISSTTGSGDQNITLNYTASTITETRSATIKFSNTTYSKEVEFTLTQAAFEPALTLSKSTDSVTVDSGSFTFDVTSNLDWATADVPDWITLTPSSGSGDQTVTLSYTANTATEARSATIKFSNATYSKEAEITITQAAFEPALTLSKSSESVTVDSGSFTFDVTSNLDWATSDVPDWITLTPSSGSGDQTVTLSYTANSVTQTRSATIKFSNATYSKEAEITITQAASQLGEFTDGGSL